MKCRGNASLTGSVGVCLNLSPTRETILEKLAALKIPRRKTKTEADARDAIGYHLAEFFEDCNSEYNVGGYLGLKIDIDVGNGKLGIEVKLADALLRKAAEVERLIGQAVYYYRRRYKGTLIVAVVGYPDELLQSQLKETSSFLAEVDIPTVKVPIL